jgi:hypothetical protein
LLVTPGAYPRGKHLKGAPIGLALDFPSNSKTWLESISKDKHSTLLGLVISEEGKKFYNIDTWFQGHKTFFSLSLTLRSNDAVSLSLSSLSNLV